MACQIRWKSMTLDDFKGQYCNRNCIGSSAFSLAKRFIVRKIYEMRSIFLLVIYDCSCLYRLERRPRVIARDVCYTGVNYGFRQQRSIKHSLHGTYCVTSEK